MKQWCKYADEFLLTSRTCSLDAPRCGKPADNQVWVTRGPAGPDAPDGQWLVRKGTGVDFQTVGPTPSSRRAITVRHNSQRLALQRLFAATANA